MCTDCRRRKIDQIDFVRVYSGLNQKCPQPEWWGETSTEILCAEDLHLEASLNAIIPRRVERQWVGDLRSGMREVWSGNTPVYDLQGRRILPSSLSAYPSSLIISNGKKYLTK